MEKTLTAMQCRAARGLIGWSQADLLAATKGNGKAAVSIKTLSDFEAGKTTPYASTLERLREALEAGGVSFVEPNGMGPGVRMRENNDG